MNAKGNLLAIAALVILGSGLIGCESVSEVLSIEDARMTIDIHDQSAQGVAGIAEAHVSFDMIELRIAGTDAWRVAAFGDIPSFELLSLTNGNEAELGSNTVAPGAYDGMRVWLESAAVVLDDLRWLDLAVTPGPVLVENFGRLSLAEGSQAVVSLTMPSDTSFSVAGSEVVFTPTLIQDMAVVN